MLEDIIKRQSDILISRIKMVRSVKFPDEKIVTIDDPKSYNMDKFLNDFQGIENDYALYVFSSKEFSISHDEIKMQFNELKSKRNPYHISKINETNFWRKRNDEFILYVGSKEKDIKKRMKEHLGLNTNNRSTYSLFIKDWWPKNVALTIKIWSLEKSIGETDRYEALQIIEDLIWDDLKPLFGKKGATFNKKH